MRSEGAVIENNRFKGCFSCITLESGRGHRIVGNRIARGQFGDLTPPRLEGSEITRNEISDTMNGFVPAPALAKPEPLLPEIEAVVNATSLAPGPVAPGSLVTILGKNLGRRALAGTEVVLAVGGCSLRMCGTPARLFSSSPDESTH